jgi:hypothetical protein
MKVLTMKALKKAVVVLCSCVFLLGSASSALGQTGTTRSDASDQTVITEHVFGLGLSVSLATGSGFSFRHHLPNMPLSYQLSGYVWDSGFEAFSIGLELQFDLFLNASGRLYALAGLSRYGYEDGDARLDDPNRLGVGVGYELPLSDTFGLSANLTVTSFQPSGDILPLPGGGVYIYF